MNTDTGPGPCDSGSAANSPRGEQNNNMGMLELGTERQANTSKHRNTQHRPLEADMKRNYTATPDPSQTNQWGKFTAMSNVQQTAGGRSVTPISEHQQTPHEPKVFSNHTDLRYQQAGNKKQNITQQGQIPILHPPFVQEFQPGKPFVPFGVPLHNAVAVAMGQKNMAKWQEHLTNHQNDQKRYGTWFPAPFNIATGQKLLTTIAETVPQQTLDQQKQFSMRPNQHQMAQKNILPLMQQSMMNHQVAAIQKPGTFWHDPLNRQGLFTPIQQAPAQPATSINNGNVIGQKVFGHWQTPAQNPQMTSFAWTDHTVNAPVGHNINTAWQELATGNMQQSQKRMANWLEHPQVPDVQINHRKTPPPGFEQHVQESHQKKTNAWPEYQYDQTANQRRNSLWSEHHYDQGTQRKGYWQEQKASDTQAHQKTPSLWTKNPFGLHTPGQRKSPVWPESPPNRYKDFTAFELFQMIRDLEAQVTDLKKEVSDRMIEVDKYKEQNTLLQMYSGLPKDGVWEETALNAVITTLSNSIVYNSSNSKTRDLKEPSLMEKMGIMAACNGVDVPIFSRWSTLIEEHLEQMKSQQQEQRDQEMNILEEHKGDQAAPPSLRTEEDGAPQTVLKEELAKAEGKLKEREMRLAKCRKHIGELRKNTIQQHNRIKKLNEDQQVEKKEFEALKKSMEETRKSVDRQQRDLENKDSAIKRFQKLLKEVQEEKGMVETTLATERKKFSKKYLSIEEDIHKLRKNVESYSATNAKQELDINNLTQKTQEADKIIRSKDELLKKTRQEARNCEQEAKRYTSQNHALDRLIHSKEDEIMRLRSKTAQCEEQAKEVAKKLTDMEKTVAIKSEQIQKILASSEKQHKEMLEYRKDKELLQDSLLKQNEFFTHVTTEMVELRQSHKLREASTNLLQEQLNFVMLRLQKGGYTHLTKSWQQEWIRNCKGNPGVQKSLQGLMLNYTNTCPGGAFDINKVLQPLKSSRSNPETNSPNTKGDSPTTPVKTPRHKPARTTVSSGNVTPVSTNLEPSTSITSRVIRVARRLTGAGTPSKNTS